MGYPKRMTYEQLIAFGFAFRQRPHHRKAHGVPAPFGTVSLPSCGYWVNEMPQKRGKCLQTVLH